MPAERSPDRAQGRRGGNAGRGRNQSMAFTRQPQVAALRALAEWAASRGFDPLTLDALEAVIAAFARDYDAPNLELAMRDARAQAVCEALQTAVDR